MRNIVLLKIDLDTSDKPLSTAKVVATFTLTAASTNTQAATLSDGKGNEVLIPPGVQHWFERVNLADLLVRSKAGEVMFVVGHSAE
ncbi:MAG: hypothetical protein DYG92_10880 [Leptolyngbya sp. PLA1]|nr:hypothetical protein [Leptolyngbya sp. PLA1]